MEIKTVSRFEKGANTHYHVQVGNGKDSRHFVVSYFKREEPIMTSWGGEYQYAASLFTGDAAGKITSFMPLSTWPDNYCEEKSAEAQVRRYVAENSEDDEA